MLTLRSVVVPPMIRARSLSLNTYHSTATRRRHDSSSYVRWHKEREHPGHAGRAAEQADRRKHWAWSISRSSRTSKIRTCRQTQWPLPNCSRRLSGPAYAIDDETAIKVVDGTVEVVSEGNWKLFSSSLSEQFGLKDNVSSPAPAFGTVCQAPMSRSIGASGSNLIRRRRRTTMSGREGCVVCGRW